MEEVKFNCNAEEVKEVVEKALAWIAEQSEDNNYIHNVKVLTTQQYITYKDFGFVASLIPTYNKAMQIEMKKREQQKADSNSSFVGNVGERVTFEVQLIECVASWDTQYGVTFVYKMVDADGNVYTWKTGKSVANKKATVIGTVKEHKEFRGIKQTELTRCKIQ